MRKNFIGAVLGVTTLALVGCGQTTEPTNIETNTEAEVTTSVESSSEEEASASETVTVVHQLGETEVKRNPKNIVVFDYGILDTLDELEVEVTGVAPSNLPTYLSEYNSEAYENVGTLDDKVKKIGLSNEDPFKKLDKINGKIAYCDWSKTSRLL